MSTARGFTLVELILVIGILLILSGITIPFLFSSQQARNVSADSLILLSTLRRAQQQAINGLNQSSWGVAFDQVHHRLVLFAGNSFAGRNQNLDITQEYAPDETLVADFGNEIFFSAFSGQPSASGTISFSDSGNVTELILINHEGKIEFGN